MLLCIGIEQETAYEAAAGSLSNDCVIDQESLSECQSTIKQDYGTVIHSESELLSCWTVNQMSMFKKNNVWLVVHGGKLACSVCREVRNLGTSKGIVSARSHLSEEWVEGRVAPYGNEKTKQQRSLRKKIHEHRNSACHKSANAVLEARKCELLQASISVQTSEYQAETCKVFRTAYYLAKNDRPYTDHADLIELQELNGIDLGRILHSNVTCSDIVDHISDDMRKALIAKILETKSLISILIDESTSIGKTSCLIVYLRTTFDEAVGPVTFFLDIVELSRGTAEGIESALLKCLTEHGLNNDLLRACWIGLGVDGASVMLGIKGGLAARLKLMYPRLISWHCFNHRLELSVNDAIKACSEINHFRIFMDSLYATYSVSPKCLRELAECAKELEIQVQRIGRVLGVRWVASSLRTVQAVWQSYAALHKHFSDKADDTSCDSRERAKFSGFAKKLENPIFIQNLGLMYDALQELSDLSLALQKADITLPVAHRLISRQVEVFLARRDCNSHCYNEACKAVIDGNFQGVAVRAGTGNEKAIKKNQFYQALSDSIASRLMPESERAFCASVAVLDSRTWPSEMPSEYGENELRLLCDKFLLPFGETKTAFRSFKDGVGKDKCPPLQLLCNNVNTIPVSTAQCERGFSKMNIICTPLRSRLTPTRMSSLMFISMSCPPMKLWQPIKYVRTWLASNRRAANCTQGPQRHADVLHGKEIMSLWNQF